MTAGTVSGEWRRVERCSARFYGDGGGRDGSGEGTTIASRQRGSLLDGCWERAWLRGNDGVPRAGVGVGVMGWEQRSWGSALHDTAAAALL